MKTTDPTQMKYLNARVQRNSHSDSRSPHANIWSSAENEQNTNSAVTKPPSKMLL